jgi:hypothetical protein
MTTNASQNLWRFVRLDQYNRPPETSRETMRKGIFGLWRHLGWGSKIENSVFAEKELGQVPPDYWINWCRLRTGRRPWER